MTMLMNDPAKQKQHVYYQVISLSLPIRSIFTCFLQPGIGTYTNNVNKTPAIEKATKFGDKMFAHSLKDHILGLSFSCPTISPCLTNTPDGYEFLMENCQLTTLGSLSPSYRIQLDQPEDKICIFGFSRGAYTARALAGMLHKVGLLAKGNFQQLESAYDKYKGQGKKNLKKSRRFKQGCCFDVSIEFLGVWYVTRAICRLPISYLCVGTPWDLSDGIRKTCHSVVRTVPSSISAMQWLLTNVVSSLLQPTMGQKHPRTKTLPMLKRCSSLVSTPVRS